MPNNKCFHCNAEIDTDAVFCNECGMAQPQSTTSSPAQVVSGGSPISPPQSLPTVPSTSPLTTPIAGRCPKCQKLFEKDDIFCRHCAFDLSSISKVTSAHFCTRCGSSFNAGERFCSKCAADLSQSDHTIALPVPTTKRDISSSPGLTKMLSPTGNWDAHHKPAAENPSGPHWISPSAAAFVVICFFLPWLEWSCFGSSVPVSGVQLANQDGSFLLFPLAAITTIIVYFIFRSQKQLWKARPYILISSAIGLLFLLYKVNSVPSAEIFGTRISASDLGFKPQIGGFGTVIGYILAMIGCAFMSRRTEAVELLRGTQNGRPWFEESARSMGRIAALSANKAAMLCYLVPLVGPLIFSLGGLMIAKMFNSMGLMLVFSLASFLAYFVAQIIVLTVKPHKENTISRFHAFQSLLILATFLGAELLVLAFVALGNQQVRFDGELGSQEAVALLVYGLTLAFYGVLIFMSVKANKGEIYKLPQIGEWAFKFATRVKQSG
jgi:uncharacterized membrane protein